MIAARRAVELLVAVGVAFVEVDSMRYERGLVDSGYEDSRKWAALAACSVVAACMAAFCSLAGRNWYWTWGLLGLAIAALLVGGVTGLERTADRGLASGYVDLGGTRWSGKPHAAAAVGPGGGASR